MEFISEQFEDTLNRKFVFAMFDRMRNPLTLEFQIAQDNYGSDVCIDIYNLYCNL